MSTLGARSKNCFNILSNEVFDPLYSILYHLDGMTLQVRKELIHCLNTGLRQVTKFMVEKKFLQWATQNQISAELKNEPMFKNCGLIKNSLTAYVYLTTWFLQDNCKLKDKDG